MSVFEKKEENFDNHTKTCENRLIFFFGIVAILLSLLAARLYYLQIIKGKELSNKAVQQWFEMKEAIEDRGTIYDRNHIPLTNRVKEDYLIIKPNFTANDKNLEILSDLTKIEKNKLTSLILKNNKILKLLIKNKEREKVKEIVRVKGTTIIEAKKRYDESGLASHVVGYINEAENTGASGLEKAFNNELKENRLVKIGAIVDAKKEVIPGFGYVVYESDDSVQKNVVTTIDYNVQKIAEEVFDKNYHKGSVVVLEAKTGEILAMVSRPNFQQNNVGYHLNSNERELYNKALQISYPPGSVFKIVVAAAVLEEEIVRLKDEFICNGYEMLGSNMIKCYTYERGGHGSLDFRRAFVESCNSTFIQAGKILGGKKLLNYAAKFGLGKKTGVKISEEVDGILPTEDYVKGPGIGNISIGQGSLQVTPLQVARLTNIIVNGGVDVGVQLVKSIINDKGESVIKFNNKNIKRVTSVGTANKIKQMMNKVVDEGTGKKAKIEGVESGGKTGSAEAIGEDGETVHAWFTGYFRGEKSKYIITVLVEDGGSGGEAAAPLFAEISQKMLKLGF
ncbi:MAG: penicillin-binding protein 2 [Candidatus Petromonas sp.]|jgi:peptidoglycan glycosyltransferase/penicillin-binding protein 2|nr:penicillin-binding protein 2 [Candidatus Petromonas sp.]